MMHMILLSALASLACAQFPSIPGVAGPRWTGPLASNLPGQLVGDTPEVAAAKAQHYQAHAQVLAVLPVLPPEERYKKTGIPLTPQPYVQNNLILGGDPIHTSQQFTQFAEEIPRSSIGEVPEVDAARRAHLAAFEQVRKILPALKTVNNAQNVYNPVPVVSNNFYQPQPLVDTPEVAAAKAEHARAFAAVANSG